MTLEQFHALKPGDIVRTKYDSVGIVESTLDSGGDIRCSGGLWLFGTDHEDYTKLNVVTEQETPPQPEPLRFVQIVGDAEGNLCFGLGRDGLVYRLDRYYDPKLRKSALGWEPLGYPVGKESTLEALRAEEGETP